MEILLLSFPETILSRQKENGWYTVEADVLLKSSKRPKAGSRLIFGGQLEATVLELHNNGQVQLELLLRPCLKGNPLTTFLLSTARYRYRRI